MTNKTTAESVLDTLAVLWFFACLFAVGYGSFRLTDGNYFAVLVALVAWFFGAAVWADSVDRCAERHKHGGAR